MAVFKQYFHLLEETNKQTTNSVNLRNKPSSLFNCNKSWTEGQNRLLYQERQSKLMLKQEEQEGTA